MAASEPDMVQLRAKYVDDLAKSYTLSAEDAQAVVLEPEKVLPRLFARTHVDIIETTVRSIHQQIPRLVEGAIGAMLAQTEQNRAFFSAWPGLAKQEHVPVVQSIMQTYRQMNPTADWAKTVREVGATASIALKLPLPQEMLSGAGASVLATPVVNPPILPANPGGSRQGRPAGNNPWEKFNEQWEQEELREDA
jgi:hypothetical protein